MKCLQICATIIFIFCIVSNDSNAKTVHKQRIVGGQAAKDKQFPWQVAIYYDNDEGTFFSAGALIRAEWILTAGHVVSGAKVFTIHLGSNLLTAPDENRVTVGASKWIAHPDYDPALLDNDIGLIQLNAPVKLTDYIQLIALSTKPLVAGSDVILSGWGASGDWGGVELSLNFVAMKTISNTDCAKYYGAAVTDEMICAAGDLNEGPCDGDNGGPLIQIDENGATHVGVATWISTQGCKTDHPSGYTRTSEFVPWIEEQLKSLT